MQTNDTKLYLIYPSFAKFRFGWESLSSLLLNPLEYGLEVRHGASAVQDAIKLGYTVSGRDHDLIDAPAYGGIIIAHRFRRWFPAVLLRSECDFRPVPGFGRLDKSAILVLVPSIRPEHRLGTEKPPPAPSPIFSVEKASSEDACLAIAVAREKGRKGSALELLASWPTLGIRVEKVSGVPMSASPAFELIKRPEFEYEWFSMSTEGLEGHLLIAAFVYLGLELNARMNCTVRAMHLFSPNYIDDLPFPSAVRWAAKTRKIIDAYGW